jgi:hypothetical protein
LGAFAADSFDFNTAKPMIDPYNPNVANTI